MGISDGLVGDLQSHMRDFACLTLAATLRLGDRHRHESLPARRPSDLVGRPVPSIAPSGTDGPDCRQSWSVRALRQLGLVAEEHRVRALRSGYHAEQLRTRRYPIAY